MASLSGRRTITSMYGRITVFKRMMLALAAMLAMFGLAAGPAHAAGLLTLYSGTNFTGTTQTVQSPTGCTAVNSQVFPAGILSAVNDTNRTVRFFTGANCTGAGVNVAANGGSNANFVTARVSYQPVNTR